jgi:hypothetical protein
VPLAITPIRTPYAGPNIPFTYDIAVGVRHGDKALLARLDRALVEHRDDIDRILHEYGVPLAQSTALAAASRATPATPANPGPRRTHAM